MLCGCLSVARSWDWCETERRGTCSQEWFLCGMGKHQWVSRLGSPSLDLNQMLILDQMLHILEILRKKKKKEGVGDAVLCLKRKNNKKEQKFKNSDSGKPKQFLCSDLPCCETRTNRLRQSFKSRL